jgi:hypothetical protein
MHIEIKLNERGDDDDDDDDEAEAARANMFFIKLAASNAAEPLSLTI